VTIYLPPIEVVAVELVGGESAIVSVNEGILADSSQTADLLREMLEQHKDLIVSEALQDTALVEEARQNVGETITNLIRQTMPSGSDIRFVS
jgi:hypothetical protein